MNGITQTQFAEKINRSPAYVSKLKGQGRLVLDSTGKILAEESIRLITDTQSPDKVSVAERHEQERAHKTGQDADEMASIVGGAYQKARAMKEKYNAMQAKISYEKEVGEALLVDEVVVAVMDSDIMVRSSLEAIPDKMAPLLASENDEEKVKAMLIDEIEYILTSLSQRVNKLVGD